MNAVIKNNIKNIALGLVNRPERGRPRQYKYNEVLDSICLLRSRNMSWRDINDVLIQGGMKTSYRCLIHWKNETMRDVINFNR